MATISAPKADSAADIAPGAPGERAVEAEELPWIEDAGKVAPMDARALSKVFFERLQVLEEGTRDHQYARNTLIEMNLSLVHFAARRFRSREGGDMDEDITQVGTIGLIKAIDRFDLSREVEFTTFAIPYIVGEIKRFFRDTTWAVHVPRRLQELRVTLAKAKDDLAGRLDREPTVAEMARHLEMSEQEVIDGLIASNGYNAGPLDLPGEGEGPAGVARPYSDAMGAVDPALETVEDLHTLAPLLGRLDERDRRIIGMRFGQEMTQAQIGAELGISQMHVSRLLSRAVSRLRSGFFA
ncbi:SigB/SigF/SigG family RNA polymerase sigma factor [Streptomyces zhihengii]|uniref:SigB/SigF/SigG family RNA polymerase sigma factor n=1 Tax=Streptomyces zhihengii TaxID=1818004 RepID=A0ABS2V5J8_9ACTN|nr:SigB/SigF/SigG family RNA polymerase sigma factor [Streptomyces zhihengii]MBM9624255.1 SigB/SigF/SigG family RNA polymerase sigma factor [Streptomyces zhihengii]